MEGLYQCVKCLRIFSTTTDVKVFSILAGKSINCPKCDGELAEYKGD